MAVKEVLNTFCSLSGQKVSAAKTRVFFSPNVPIENKASLCEVLGFRSTPNLGKYLGFPIKHTFSTQDYGFIIEKLQGKLVGWKANLLSFTSRLVLTQSVTSTIPNYYMQCVALPLKILQNVDKTSQNFLWGSLDCKRKLHVVGWKKIIKPKNEGGLGLQSAKEKNIALLAKLNWRLHFEKESIWARVLS